MQPDYPTRFERDTGGTETEWLDRLGGACRDHPLTLREGSARVAIDGGSLSLNWRPLPPRRIALMCMPRLQVEFRFDGILPTAQFADDGMLQTGADEERLVTGFDIFCRLEAVRQ